MSDRTYRHTILLPNGGSRNVAWIEDDETGERIEEWVEGGGEPLYGFDEDDDDE